MIIVYRVNLPGYRILFTAHAFVSQGQLSLDACLHFDIPSNISRFCPVTLPIPPILSYVLNSTNPQDKWSLPNIFKVRDFSTNSREAPTHPLSLLPLSITLDPSELPRLLAQS